jgi:intracellular multiplication protein IcmK
VRAALLVSAALAGVFLAGRPGYGQAQVQLDVTAQAPPGAPAHTPAENAIPVTPEMIDDLYRRFHDVERKKEEVATELAAPINRQVNVSLAPGAATAIINTVKGYPTAVSFFDSTGQPWPIAWDTNSNPAAVAGGTNCSVANGTGGGPSVAAIGFYVCTPTKGSNVLEITPVSLVPRGGLVVSLEGAPKPIAFLLLGGGGRYDANLSVHVADRGPNAKVEIMTQPNAPDTGAPFLTSMLQGVPPADAVPLSVEGVSPEGLRAWRLGGKVYLRTRYVLLSPEWTASEAEAGTTVYAVANTPVVLVSVGGRTVSVHLQE